MKIAKNTQNLNEAQKSSQKNQHTKCHSERGAVQLIIYIVHHKFWSMESQIKKYFSRSERDQSEATEIMQPGLKLPGRDKRKRSTGSE